MQMNKSHSHVLVFQPADEQAYSILEVHPAVPCPVATPHLAGGHGWRVTHWHAESFAATKRYVQPAYYPDGDASEGAQEHRRGRLREVDGAVPQAEPPTTMAVSSGDGAPRARDLRPRSSMSWPDVASSDGGAAIWAANKRGCCRRA